MQGSRDEMTGRGYSGVKRWTRGWNGMHIALCDNKHTRDTLGRWL